VTADRGPAVITATAPTPNGPLHVGHLSGPYLAADIAARAARARGEQVLSVCGLDPHQNYVPARAHLDARAPADVLDEYEALIRQSFQACRINHDLFIDPRADAGYRAAIVGLLDEFIASKAATVEDATLAVCARCDTTLHHAYVTGGCPVCGGGSGGGTCEGCGSFTTGATLRDAHCTRCGGAPRLIQAEIPVLHVEAYRADLTRTWSTAVLPEQVRNLLGHYLADGLPDVPLAYPTDWGIAHGAIDQRVDVWVEMGLGILAGIGAHFGAAAPTVPDCLAAWRSAGPCWHFLGIDNAFYFSVLFPAMFTAAGMEHGWLGGLVVNEFYRLDGKKFSTSRNHAVWAHEFLAGEDPALVRLFLSWDRPDSYESDFTLPGYREFCAWISPALTGGPALPERLAGAERIRARQALRAATFDPGLALRCLLAAGPATAPELIGALTGDGQLPGADQAEEFSR
jgi:methionyl-tRNA synthetase